MDALSIAQSYFDAWNARDAAAVLATFTVDGTYSDPMIRLARGEALAGYVNGLWAAFPDLSFEVASAAATGVDTVAAQWIMKGTNLGSMMGLPPTGKAVVVTGADFIRVRDGKVQTVEGYFDSTAVPVQLGLKVNVGPETIGPFQFGVATRGATGKTAAPGAISITALKSRSAADQQKVRDVAQQVSMELLGAPGFISLVTAEMGDRMLTITAWESAADVGAAMRSASHAGAMKKFLQGSSEEALGGGGYASVWVPERFSTMWARCSVCNKMQDSGKAAGTCGCGASLGEAWPYW